MQGTPCDLITGEERRHASQYNVLLNEQATEPQETELLINNETELTPSNHVACTVEMTSLNNSCKLIYFTGIDVKK